jgi:flagellar protein FliO/FliZ
MGQGLTSLLWFVGLIALIPVALWLLKRTPLGGGATGTSLKSVGVLPLSASQRIVTVEVGHGDNRRWLVLGITPNNIQTLHLMDAQDLPPGNTPQPTPPVAFAQLLSRLRPEGRDTHGR